MTTETLLDDSATKTSDTPNTQEQSPIDTAKQSEANQVEGIKESKTLLDEARTSEQGKTPEAETPTEEKAVVVPEKYEDPKLPEGFSLNPEIKTEFDSVAKDLKLTQEQYQKIVDLQVKHSQSQIKQTMDQFNKMVSDMKEETIKELGPNTEKALADAARAIDRALPDPKDNKEFRELMSSSGLGNSRLVVKLLSNLGKNFAEGKFVEGIPDTKRRKSDAEVLFDHPTSVASLKFD